MILSCQRLPGESSQDWMVRVADHAAQPSKRQRLHCKTQDRFQGTALSPYKVPIPDWVVQYATTCFIKDALGFEGRLSAHRRQSEAASSATSSPSSSNARGQSAPGLQPRPQQPSRSQRSSRTAMRDGQRFEQAAQDELHGSRRSRGNSLDGVIKKPAASMVSPATGTTTEKPAASMVGRSLPKKRERPPEKKMVRPATGTTTEKPAASMVSPATGTTTARRIGQMRTWEEWNQRYREIVEFTRAHGRLPMFKRGQVAGDDLVVIRENRLAKWLKNEGYRATGDRALLIQELKGELSEAVEAVVQSSRSSALVKSSRSRALAKRPVAADDSRQPSKAVQRLPSAACDAYESSPSMETI